MEVGVDGEALRAGAAAAVRHPARRPDRPPATGGARPLARPPRPSTSPRATPLRPCGGPPWAGRRSRPMTADVRIDRVEPAEERLARRLERTLGPVRRDRLLHALGHVRPTGLRRGGPAVDARPSTCRCAAVHLRQPLQAVVPGGRRARGRRRPAGAAGRAHRRRGDRRRLAGREPADEAAWATGTARHGRSTGSPRRAGSPMPTSTSFPSGHSASALAFAVAVGDVVPGAALAAARCRRASWRSPGSTPASTTPGTSRRRDHRRRPRSAHGSSRSPPPR